MSLVRVTFEPVDQILADTRAEMYRLFKTYYQGVSEVVFFADLADKELVLMVRKSDSHTIVGFSTIMRQEVMTRNGTSATAVFSGDTVMDKSFWGVKVFQWEFTRYLLRLKFSAPHRQLYWMLMSKGFKTYLMVKRNCPRTFPSLNLEDDSDLRYIRDAFYSQKYPSAFDPKTGLVRFESARGAVAFPYAGVDSSATDDPDVAFFLTQNPDYKSGVELACVAEVRIRDFPIALAKYLGKVANRTFSRRQQMTKAG